MGALTIDAGGVLTIEPTPDFAAMARFQRDFVDLADSQWASDVLARRAGLFDPHESVPELSVLALLLMAAASALLFRRCKSHWKTAILILGRFALRVYNPAPPIGDIAREIGT